MRQIGAWLALTLLRTRLWFLRRDSFRLERRIVKARRSQKGSIYLIDEGKD
jgi:hypothetical protein